ncbi:MAG: hypothetical protein ACE5JR_01365 [Gemmatimonadota bacterium]
MSPDIYKFVHILGILLAFTALGAVSLHALNGGSRESNRSRKLVAFTFGTGMLLLLVGGFGQLAKLGMGGGLPGWAWGKLAIWLALGALLILPYHRPDLARLTWFGAPALGALAAYLALDKPF